MSTNVKSSIFRDFIFRIKEISLSCFQHTVTIEPKSYADIYHFHRPQKCDIEQIPEKSLVTLHFDPFDFRQHSSMEELFQKLSLFKKVVFLNQNSFEQCSFLGEKRVLIPHGYDERLQLRQQKKPHFTFNVAVISRYYSDGRKGDAYLFDLLAGLPNDIRLYLVGNCWPKRLEKRSKQIYVIHPTSYYDIIRIYSAIDMVLITSPYEGGPACLPEALAAGCLVFSSRSGMAEDLLDTRFLLDYNLTSDINKILMAKSLFKNEIENYKAHNLITWETVSHRYNCLYQSML
ncbi:glycosyltransferase [Escherichia coli]|uniref:glycosyltransferase n=1 Tax=Escherichia coli TaxID=562 RepID=UPI00211B3689|nr:glycosyltransferase [Escherichia coli]